MDTSFKDKLKCCWIFLLIFVGLFLYDSQWFWEVRLGVHKDTFCPFRLLIVSCRFLSECLLFTTSIFWREAVISNPLEDGHTSRNEEFYPAGLWECHKWEVPNMQVVKEGISFPRNMKWSNLLQPAPVWFQISHERSKESATNSFLACFGIDRLPCRIYASSGLRPSDPADCLPGHILD